MGSLPFCVLVVGTLKVVHFPLSPIASRLAPTSPTAGTRRTPAKSVLTPLPLQFILTWQGRHLDHEGGSPMARRSHCTPAVLTYANSPNVGISTA